MTESQSSFTGTRFRRLATAAAFASLLAYAVVLLITPASNNEIADYFKASLEQLGLLSLATMFGFLSIVGLAGFMADRYGKLPMMLTGCACIVAGGLIFTVARSFHMAVLASALFGLGGGLTEGPAMALLADLYEDHRRTAMMNLGQSMFGAGAILGPLLIGALLHANLSWRIGYIGSAVITAMAGLLGLAAIAMRQESPAVVRGTGPSPVRFLTDKMVLLLALGILLYVGAEMAQTTWLSVHFKRNLHATSATAAASPSYMWLGIGVGRILGAAFAKYVSDYSLIVWSMVIAVASQGFLLMAGSPSAAEIAALGLGFGLAAVFPTIVSRASAVHPEASGSVTALVFVAGGLGGALFPPAVGWLGDRIGLASALWVCFGALATDLALFVWLRAKST